MLLPWLILLPFIGGLLCWQAERFGTKLPRWIALLAMGIYENYRRRATAFVAEVA